MNVDRDQYGNLLMEQAPGQKWSLIPADHSDCFGGADTFSSGRYISAAESRGSARFGRILGQLLARALLECGIGALRAAVDRVRAVQHLTGTACGRVPSAWWAIAEIEPDEVTRCLTARARRIERIVDVDRWEGLADAVAGGAVLDI